jgi:hypothetical protein
MDVLLTDGQHVAGVDDEDVPPLLDHRWRAIPGKRGTYYAICQVRHARNTPCNTYMHVLILGVKNVDHRDHDGLNNHRYNLRVSTGTLNNANSRKREGTSSRFKGVSWSKRRRKWRAVVQVEGRYKELGLFNEEAEAARSYDRAAVECFGEFACTNEMQGLY